MNDQARGLIAARDHDLRAKVRRTLLQAGVVVVFEASTTAQAIIGAATTRPTLCVLSTCLDGQGLIAVAKITSRMPRVPVLLLDHDLDHARLSGALRAGASGYLPADLDDGSFLRALRSIRHGELAIPRHMVQHLVDELLRPGRRTASTLLSGGEKALTRREREILDLLGRGLSSERIGEELFLETTTVRSHIYRIGKKLGLRGRDQLVRYARRSGRGG